MFDFKKFIRDNFQSPAGVIAHCRSFGLEPPSEEQVSKWLQRNSVPGEWLAKLISLLEHERGEPVSVQIYFGSAT